MWRQYLKAGWIIGGLTLMLIGCGTNAGGRSQAKQYDNDGLLGATSSNPNLPTSPTYHNYSNDVKLMKDTIAGFTGVADSTILLNGPTAYVTLQLNDDIDIEESMRIRNHAQTSLQRMMPRYDLRVSVGKNHFTNHSHQ